MIEHGRASLLYVQNWKLALDAVDYRAAVATAASPVQHFWSLPVQGQVFVLWPLLLAACVLVARRTRFSFTAVAATAFSAIFVASLAFSVHETETHQAFAYFDTRTRLWEFAAGSLLALALPHLRPGRMLAPVLGRGGMLLILACGLVLQVEDQFPGWIALIPVLGAATVITHLVTAGTDTVSVGEGTAVIAVSGLLAWGTTHLVERPLQGWSWVHHRERRDILLSVGCALGVAVPLAGRERSIGIRQEQVRQQIAAFNPGAQVLVSSESRTPPPDAGLLPLSTELEAERGYAGPDREGEYVLEDPALTSCHQIEPEGPATRTVVVIGDSHANQLMPALTRVAEDERGRLISLLRNACRYGTESDTRDEECAARDYVLEHRPDAVLTHGTPSSAEEPYEVLVPGWEDGIAAFVEEGIDVIALRDNPRFAIDMVECVEMHGRHDPRCNTPREQALLPTNPIESVTAREPPVHSLDITQAYCTDTTCPAVIGNMYVYLDLDLDLDHLTRTHVETFTDYLGEEIVSAVDWDESSA